jgi:hypothetical protein
MNGRKEVRPSAKPPSAWHACVPSVSVLAKSLDRMVGISEKMQERTKSVHEYRGCGLPL